MVWLRHTVTIMLSILTLYALQAQKVYAEEIRFLVDESASMIDTDPQKIRGATLQVIADLLPKGTKAGVFGFSTEFRVLLPVSIVDAQWQKRARLIFDKLNSKGQYTRLDQAILKTTKSWFTTPVTEKRILILMTDGKIDVSDNTKPNVLSTKTLLKKIVPELNKHHISVYTIGLSQNINKSLLTKLANQTHGQFQMVKNPKILEDNFYQIFHQIKQTKEISIKNNKFKVTNDTKRMTIIFTNTNEKSVKLIKPTGISLDYKKVDTFKMGNNFIVTIVHPIPGQWEIEDTAKTILKTPVIFSNIDIITNRFKNHLFAGEKLVIYAFLVSHGKRIKDDLVIDNTNIDFKFDNNKYMPMNKPNFSEINFRKDFYVPENLDENIPISFRAKSKMFQITKKKTVRIEKFPFTINFRRKNKFKVQLQVTTNSSNIADVNLLGIINFPMHTKRVKFIEYSPKTYYARYDIECANDGYSLTLNISGKKINGENFKFEPIVYEQSCQEKSPLVSQIEPIHNNDLLSKIPESLAEKNKKKQKKSLSTVDLWTVPVVIIILMTGCACLITSLYKNRKINKARKILESILSDDEKTDDDKSDKQDES